MKTSDISLGELNVSPTTTTKEDNTATTRTVCDRIEYSDRTSLGSFWPEPDRKVNWIRKDWPDRPDWPDFTGFKIILTLALCDFECDVLCKFECAGISYDLYFKAQEDKPEKSYCHKTLSLHNH